MDPSAAKGPHVEQVLKATTHLTGDGRILVESGQIGIEADDVWHLHIDRLQEVGVPAANVQHPRVAIDVLADRLPKPNQTIPPARPEAPIALAIPFLPVHTPIAFQIPHDSPCRARPFLHMAGRNRFIWHTQNVLLTVYSSKSTLLPTNPLVWTGKWSNLGRFVFM